MKRKTVWVSAVACKVVVAAVAVMQAFAAACAEYDFVSAPEAPFKMPNVPVWRVPAREFPITDYGAVTGAVKNTAAFAKAIAACSSAGGGRVVVPKGDWRTGAIHLKSNVALDLREGSRIVFTDDPADYLPAVHTNWEGVEAMGYSPLIFAYCCTNVAIVGKGRIAPETKLWRTKWDNRSTPMHKAFIATLYDWCSMGVPLEKRDITRFPGSHARPHLIQFNRSANILLEDFLIRGSPFWNIHLFHSENVVVRGIDIYSHGHNTDGIDIDMTKNVIVENCVFDQGDDAVILKAARNHDAWRLGRSTENVVVRHCTVRNGHVLMGAGSDVSGGIRNVLMHDCQMVGNVNNVFFVKTNERRGGFVENIYMKDCSVEMRGKSVPTSVVGIETDVLYEWRNLPTWEVRVTRIRNICAENVRATRARHLLMVHGDARDPVDGVTLKNVTCGETTQEKIVVVNAKNVTMDGKPVPSRPGKAPSW